MMTFRGIPVYLTTIARRDAWRGLRWLLVGLLGLALCTWLFTEMGRTASAPAPLVRAALYVERPAVQCAGITRAGRRCKHLTRDPSHLCAAHRWQREN